MSKRTINAGVIGRAAAGADGWTQLTTVEQGTTVGDPGAVLATATWSSGVLTMVPKNSATPQIDGRTENLPGVSALLSTLLPNFDFTKPGARLEILVAIDSMPATTAKWGLCVGVADADIATAATRNAALIHCFPNSATLWNVGALADAAVQTSVSQGSTQPQYMLAEVSYNPDTLGLTLRGQVYNTAGTEQEITTFTGTADTAGSLASLRLMLAAIKVDGTVAGQPTLQARCWFRGIDGVPFP